MTIRSNEILFPEGFERSIRNRLGLGQVQQVDIRTVLEVAKVHKYFWESIGSRHWAFSAPKMYSIYTGDCKSGWYTQNFDLGVDQDGMVTHIVECRGYPPDFGIGDFFASMFRFGTKDNKVKDLVASDSKKMVEFPNGKEKQIREVIGLADSNYFHRRDILTLAKFHGYTEGTGISKTSDLFRISPSSAERKARKPCLEVVVDNDEAVRSIVAIK